MASGLSVQYDKTQSHRTSFDLNIIIIKQKNLTSTQYPGHKKLFVTRYTRTRHFAVWCVACFLYHFLNYPLSISSRYFSRYIFLYPVGDTPFALLKSRLKYIGLSYPTIDAILLIESSVISRSVCAFRIRV